jgi:hypothetical protein
MFAKVSTKQKIATILATVCTLVVFISNFFVGTVVEFPNMEQEEIQEMWLEIDAAKQAVDNELTQMLTGDLGKELKGILNIFRKSSKGIGVTPFGTMKLCNFLGSINEMLDSLGSFEELLDLDISDIPEEVRVQLSSLSTMGIVLGISIFAPFVIFLILHILSFIFPRKLYGILFIILGSTNFIGRIITPFIYNSYNKKIVALAPELEGEMRLATGYGNWIAAGAFAVLIVCGILIVVSPTVTATNHYAALVGLSGAYAGASIFMQPNEEIVIGRDTTVSHVVLSDSQVSRKHCGVRYIGETGNYQVVDYSSNGTFVNGAIIPTGVNYDCAPGTILSVDDFNRFQLQ